MKRLLASIGLAITAGGCGDSNLPPHNVATKPLDSSAAVANEASAPDPETAAPAHPAESKPRGGTPRASRLHPIAPAPSAEEPTVRYRNGKLVQDSSPPVIELMSEFDDRKHGELAVPAYPGDIVYMGVNVQTEGGSPLKNVEVHIESRKGNRSVLTADRTDKAGYLEFRLLATQPGEDTVTVSAAGIARDFLMEVTPPPRGEWLGGLDLRGVTPWDILMSADVKLGSDRVEAKFPFPLQSLADQSVRLVGFMVPLGINEKQTHFLLSANPPSCFFHPPGGPSSAVEVFADKAVEMTYDPMILEGRFELIEHSEGGILYKLHSARLVSKSS